MPVGGAAVKAYSLGGSILKGGLTTARAGAIGATGAEALLQETQESRTLGESALNVAGATLLSGVLGGAIGGLAPKELANLSARVESDLTIPKPDELDLAEPNSIVVGGSGGAAAVRSTTLEQEALSNAWGVDKAAAAIRLNPKIRLATSPSVESRRFIQELAETPFYTNKNDSGIATPVAIESKIDLQNAKLGRAVEQQTPLFKKYKQRAKADTEQRLTYLQFREEAAKASRRNDKHVIPEVQELAQIYRREVLNPLRDDGIKVGLLDKNVKVETADSYLHRWWDKNKIAAKRPELQQIIVKSMRSLPEVTKGEVGADEIESIASDIINTLLGSADARIPYDVPLAPRGPLKERTLSFIKDIDVEDYLINDIEAIAKKYVRTMSADIAIKDWFGDMNIVGKDGFITNKINEDYDRLVGAAKTEKERKKLEDQRGRDIRDIEAIVDQLRGTYGQPNNPDSLLVRGARSARDIQFITKLGGMTGSAFPDVARPVMVHGMQRVFKDGVIPLIKNFKTFKLAAREIKEYGPSWDMILDSRAMTMAEVNDPYVTGSKFEKGLKNLTNTFGKVTLMTQWNTVLKQFTGVITQRRITDSVRKSVSGSISKKDVRYLAMVGIDANMAKRITKQLDEFGDQVDGVQLARTRGWTDNEAFVTFAAAINKEVDRAIVTPKVGDIPLILKGTEAGKMIGQFKSFSFASTNKILISGLQEADMSTLNGWALAIGMGMVSYAFKTWDRGGELSDDPRVWITEGVDRSGVLASLGEVNQLMNKLTSGQISLQALAGAPPLTRYANTNIEGLFLGPTIGTVGDIFQVSGAISRGEWTASDSRAMRRMIPYQNLILARRLFDQAEEGINDAIGVKK